MQTLSKLTKVAETQFKVFEQNFPDIDEDYSQLRSYHDEIGEVYQNCSKLVQHVQLLSKKTFELKEKAASYLKPDEKLWMKWNCRQLVSFVL